MISHKHKCIFIEVPKTGSTSIRSIVGIPPKPHQNIWEMKSELENSWTRYGGWGNRILSSLYLLVPGATRKVIGQGLFCTYFKFGFVRNPWDRAVSLYERREGLQLRDVMSFEQFIEWMKYSSSTCIHPMPHRNQLDWFIDPHGRVLADFIGRFETFEKDWAFIAKRLGLPPGVPHLNRNPRRTKPYTEYYTSRSRQIIAERFKDDIEYFGYEFDGPEPQSDCEYHLRRSLDLKQAVGC